MRRVRADGGPCRRRVDTVSRPHAVDSGNVGAGGEAHVHRERRRQVGPVECDDQFCGPTSGSLARGTPFFDIPVKRSLWGGEYLSSRANRRRLRPRGSRRVPAMW
jgi:hypothetical protein